MGGTPGAAPSMALRSSTRSPRASAAVISSNTVETIRSNSEYLVGTLQAETGVYLGKVLLMSGALDANSLREVLEIKLREAIWDVLSWQGGHFQFDEGPRGGSEFEVRVPLRTTLDLGKLQVARLRTIRQLIPRDDVRFFVTDFFAVQDPSRSERIRAQTDRLVGCVERGLTLNQIILEHHGRRFQVTSRLAELIERGALARVIEDEPVHHLYRGWSMSQDDRGGRERVGDRRVDGYAE